MHIYEVWYTKPNGEFLMAWQGLTYQQAVLKVKEMAILGYDNACICTPPTREFLMAWQGLTYQQAVLKVKEMAILGYDNACICTPPTRPS